MSKLWLKIGSDEYEIRSDGFLLKECAGEQGKHASSSCQVAIRGTQILSSIMYKEGLVDASVIDDDGSSVFTGVIRPYASITAEPMYLGDLQLEVLDYTEKLHKKVYAKLDDDSPATYPEGTLIEKDWTDIKVCNPADTDNSIVHLLLDMAGITKIGTLPAIDVTLKRFSLKYGDYLDDVLGTLLYEYIYDYRFTKDGTFQIYQTGTITKIGYGDDGKVDETKTQTIRLLPSKTVDVFRNSLDISRSDDKSDGCLVTYKKYKERSDLVIGTGIAIDGNTFVFDLGWSAKGTIDIKWDSDDIDKLVDADGENATDIIYSNLSAAPRVIGEYWLLDVAVYKAELAILETRNDGCTVSYDLDWGAGGFGEWKIAIDIYGDASYYQEDTQTVGYAGENAEEYNADYIDNIEDAMCLSRAIMERQKDGAFSYSFDSFEKIEPGTVITINEAIISGAVADARITKRTIRDDTGLYSYTAEGYGEAEWREPELNRDDAIDNPVMQRDFFLLKVSESVIDEADMGDESILAQASGLIFSRYGGTPEWYLNGNLMASFTATGISFAKTMLAVGKNTLECRAEYDGKIYSRTALIHLYGIPDLDIQMQFALVPSGQSPDSSTVWLDSQPVPGQGQVVWMRFRTSTSGEWIVMKMTAEDGGNPVVFFQWAATPYIKPDEGYELLTWDNMAITWETGDEVMGFILDSGRWETMVPEKPFGLNYLWVKYWNYTEEKWDYFCTTGTPAMSFDLIVNPQTFKLTTRGVVKEDTEQTDGCQRITVRCQRYNTTAPISWMIEPEDEDLLRWERVVDADDSEIRIILNPLVVLGSVHVHCSIADIEVAKDFLITGVQEGTADQMYLGIISSTATFPVDTSEGQLMVGDHILVENEDGSRTPYYYTGQPGDDAWVVADMDTPSSFVWKILQNCLYDAVMAPSAVESQSVINLFAQNFAAYNAFIQNLWAQQIQVLNVLFGGDYYASGQRIEAPEEGEEDKRKFGGKGFHFSAQTGLLQATKAQLYDVDIMSVDASKKTVLKTYRSDGVGAFDCSVTLSPTCFKRAEYGVNAVWLQDDDIDKLVYQRAWESAVGVQGNALKIHEVGSIYYSIMTGGVTGGDGIHRTIKTVQACTMGISFSANLTWGSGYHSSDQASITVKKGSTTLMSLVLDFSVGETKTYNKKVLIDGIDVAADETLEVIFWYDGVTSNGGKPTFKFFVEHTSNLKNVFTQVSNPESAWVWPARADDECDEIVASSDYDYINPGNADITSAAGSKSILIRYASYDTGIMDTLSAEFVSGNTYPCDAGSYIVWDGLTKNVTRVDANTGSYTFFFEDGGSAVISDTHTACEFSVSGSSQPSYVDIYRLTVSDPNGSIGISNSEAVPNIYAKYFHGRISTDSMAGRGTDATLAKAAFIISTHAGVIGSEAHQGTIDPGKCYAELRSNGIVDLSFYVGCSDDAIGYVGVPVLFEQIYGVQASAYRVNMEPDGNSWPGLSGTGKAAQFDATDFGEFMPTWTGVTHNWTRILVMNDWEEVRGFVHVIGLIAATQYSQIINNGGDMSVIFDLD